MLHISSGIKIPAQVRIWAQFGKIQYGCHGLNLGNCQLLQFQSQIFYHITFKHYIPLWRWNISPEIEFGPSSAKSNMAASK